MANPEGQGGAVIVMHALAFAALWVVAILGIAGLWMWLADR
jgi:hypothetical protein